MNDTNNAYFKEKEQFVDYFGKTKEQLTLQDMINFIEMKNASPEDKAILKKTGFPEAKTTFDFFAFRKAFMEKYFPEYNKAKPKVKASDLLANW